VSPYAEVNGLLLYYEVHGQGHPLVLLPGGLQTIELAFGPLIPRLAQSHQVIALELQGHGRTADSGRPFALAHLADDVASLLDQLDLDRADVFGFSLGGMVALELARRRPARVRRLIVASVDPRPGPEGMGPGVDPEEAARRRPTQADFQAMRDAYARLAPDPAHFDEFAARASAMVHAVAGWSDDELAAIGMPTLLLVGDTDFVPLPHAVAMLDVMPRAQLAVLPGTTHMGLLRRVDEVCTMVLAFLDEPAP
jgi:pimeloyl-ACP methyl ester carboxylesterase